MKRMKRLTTQLDRHGNGMFIVTAVGSIERKVDSFLSCAAAKMDRWMKGNRTHQTKLNQTKLNRICRVNNRGRNKKNEKYLYNYYSTTNTIATATEKNNTMNCLQWKWAFVIRFLIFIFTFLLPVENHSPWAIPRCHGTLIHWCFTIQCNNILSL